ncbi:amidase (plasmid) [Rossellomorea sp. FS2]|uniref:amidase n=1 Tax=Rossellomorea sp. FS2 TaxID=3391447 RepID=UPI003A4DF5FB
MRNNSINKLGSIEESIRQTLTTIFYNQHKTNSFITVNEEALMIAKVLDQELQAGKLLSDFHGKPVAIKDLIHTNGIETTMGSKIYENFFPDEDATIIRSLKGAGAIVIGKTHTHELAYGPLGDRSFVGPCFNPHNPRKITGGSSSGSAAAVGAGLVDYAIGTDTGGSIRIPASACGVVGMKPTFGLVSKKGVQDLAYSLDHVGPITSTVLDNAKLLNVLAGFDSGDPYSLMIKAKDYTSLIGNDIKDKVIGVPFHLLDPIQDEVKESFGKAIKMLKDLGAIVKEVTIKHLDEIKWAQEITIQAEAAEIHKENFENHKDLMDSEVYERLSASRNVKAYEYIRAQQIRSRLTSRYNKIFEEVSILFLPTLPILPPDIGQREIILNGETKSVRQLLLSLTSPTNLTGNPSLSIPGEPSRQGLPIGLQLISKHGNEEVLYQFAHALERKIKDGR